MRGAGPPPAPGVDAQSTPTITPEALKIAAAALPLARPRRSTLSLVTIAATCAPPAAEMMTSLLTAPFVTDATVPAMQLRADTLLLSASTITITDEALTSANAGLPAA